MQRAWFIVKILERSTTYRKSSNRHSGHSGHSQRTRPNTNNFQQRESATIVVMFVLSVCDIYFVMSCLLIVLFYTHVVLFHRPLCLKTFKKCPMFLSVSCYSPFPSPRGKVRLSYKLRFSYVQEST